MSYFFSSLDSSQFRGKREAERQREKYSTLHSGHKRLALGGHIFHSAGEQAEISHGVNERCVPLSGHMHAPSFLLRACICTKTSGVVSALSSPSLAPAY